MAYIGKEPTIGNFQKCDAISVVNGQAAYTLQVGGTNVVPESVNHMLVSLNGILQAPTDSFTVSGSTLTFASNLATGDVIDFVMILGNVLDLGVPSDNTVTTAKLGANSVTAAKLNNDIISGTTALTSAPADTDEFLVSDAGTLKRIDYSLIKGGGMWEFVSKTDVTSAVSSVDFTSFSTDYTDFCVVINNISLASDNQELNMRFYASDGTLKTSSNYEWTFSGSDTGATQNDNNGIPTDAIILGRPMGNAANSEHGSYEITFYNVHNTTDYKYGKFTQIASNTGTEPTYNDGGFWWSDNVSGDYSMSGVHIKSNSGNISSGEFTLYGRKHS